MIARLKVISVASTSAVCEVVATKRDLAKDDMLSLPDSEVKKIVDKDAVGNTRHYPMVISFSDGDPMDEEVRDNVPRPPLPEVNEMRGRFGFDMSTIQSLQEGGSSTTEYGMVMRADFTRLFGTHWNLNGYWRGTFQHSPEMQQSIQDVMNRTYLMALSYINPESMWSASIGRMYVPYASSLETVDGAFVGLKLTSNGTLGMFAGSTPDPTAWNYNPDRRMGGGFFNWHGGSFETLHYSSTVGAGVQMLKWAVDRPFIFTENDFSYKKIFSVYHSMQIDKPTANPGAPPWAPGLGQSLLSLRLQVHPRVMLDFNHTYFRDVPTYDSVLVGTGLLDKYLYQGFNGGARVQLPLHLVGYASLGESNSSERQKERTEPALRIDRHAGVEDRPGNRRALFEIRQRVCQRDVSHGKHHQGYGAALPLRRNGRALRLFLVAGANQQLAVRQRTFRCGPGSETVRAERLYHPARRNFGLQPVDHHPWVPVRQPGAMRRAERANAKQP